jgi:hypothetical protein
MNFSNKQIRLLVPFFLLITSCEEIDLTWNLPRKPFPEITMVNPTPFGVELTINVAKDGGSKVTECGVCYSQNGNPTTNDSIARGIVGIGTSSINISGLIPGTKYYLKAYAKNKLGIGYGDLTNFTTVIFSVTTNSISLITQTTARSGGTIPNYGGVTIVSRGVCWNNSPHPTISNNKTVDGVGTGTFISNLSGLMPSTKYYVRAYASTNDGTAYGGETSFTTATPSIPTITTTGITENTGTSAKSGGTIISDGGSVIITRGVCWNTTGNPTISNNYTNDGSGTGSFISSITGLVSGTYYYVRAYATNSIGTGYGTAVTFTAGTNVSYLINDNFESYALGIFPSSGGWYERYNGSGQNIVTNSVASSGSKSFRLKGLSSWSATIENHNAGWQAGCSTMNYELSFYTSGGDHSMGFLDYSPIWGLSFGTIVFQQNGTITADNSGTATFLTSYSFNQWYKVRVQVYNTSPYLFKVWVDGLYLGEFTSPQNSSYSITQSYFHINAGHAGFYGWYDDVKVWYE